MSAELQALMLHIMHIHKAIDMMQSFHGRMRKRRMRLINQILNLPKETFYLIYFGNLHAPTHWSAVKFTNGQHPTFCLEHGGFDVNEAELNPTMRYRSSADVRFYGRIAGYSEITAEEYTIQFRRGQLLALRKKTGVFAAQVQAELDRTIFKPLPFPEEK